MWRGALSEGEVGGGDRIHVIQRDRGGVAELAINAEFDVAQAEGFGSCAAALVVVPSRESAAFRWPHEPVESHDTEVDDIGVELAIDGVLGVEDFGEHVEHVDGCGAGLGARVVIVLALLEESRQCGMASVRSENFEAGILLTQVGDPLSREQQPIEVVVAAQLNMSQGHWQRQTTSRDAWRDAVCMSHVA